MKHIYCCDCGTQTEVQAHQLGRGNVMQCPSCKKVCAHVASRGRGSCWITVDPKEVEFYDILGVRYDGGDDDATEIHAEERQP